MDELKELFTFTLEHNIILTITSIDSFVITISEQD